MVTHSVILLHQGKNWNDDVLDDDDEDAKKKPTACETETKVSAHIWFERGCVCVCVCIW